jgi:hypothetical protein
MAPERGVKGYLAAKAGAFKGAASWSLQMPSLLAEVKAETKK